MLTNFKIQGIKFLLLFIFFLGTQALLAQQENTQISEAADAYSNQEYQKAIDLYEQILSDGKDAFEIYYNLGNTYFKEEGIGAAILNYERAARIDPANADLQHNLKMAQARTVDKIEMISVPEFVTGYKSFVNTFSSDSWGKLSLLTFSLLLIFLLVFLFSNKKWMKQIALGSGILFLFLTTLFFYFGWQQERWLNDQKEAIIFKPSITVTSTPDNAGEELFVLHEGTKVRIIERFRDWTRIRIGNGNTGWIPKEVAEEI